MPDPQHHRSGSPATPGQPLDPDAPTTSRGTRPVHLRPGAVLVVAAGGAVGTAAREGMSLAVPSIGGFPLAILLINVVGAFLLGLLLEALARRGADEGRRRTLRLLLGTGFCGGFTTYSALASATALLLVDGDAATGVLYAAATLLVGGLASWAGIACGALVGGRR